MSAARTGGDVVKLVLRLPKSLHRWLVQTAKRNNVSLNTEIINGLRGYETTLAKGLRDQIEAAAAASGRSLVREIEHRLEQSFQSEEANQIQRVLLDRSLTTEDMITLAAVGTPAGRYASVAAIQTEQGKAAAEAAINRYKSALQAYQGSTPELEREIFEHGAKPTEDPEQKD